LLNSRGDIQPAASCRGQRCRLAFRALSATAAAATAAAVVGGKAVVRRGHLEGPANAWESAEQQQWLATWPQVESNRALGSGNALHARGLVKIRGGDMCLHAKRGFGSQVFLGPCEGDGLLQEWQYDAHLGHLKHAFAGCLDGGGETLHMWMCQGSNPSQRWAYDAKIGKLVNRAAGTCLDAIHPGRLGGKVHLWRCIPHFQRQEWSIGLRIGQVQLWRGVCLWAQGGELGGEVRTRSCGSHSNEQWLFDPSLGWLEHRTSRLCLTSRTKRTRKEKHVHLASCASGAVRSRGQRWLHNVVSGELRLVYGGGCLHGDYGLPVRVEACRGSLRGMRQWTTGALTGQIRLRHGFCLHASAAGKNKQHAQVFLWVCEAREDQQWTYDSLSGRIQHLSGLCLKRDGEVVFAGKCRNPFAEHWLYNVETGHILHGTSCLEASSPGTAGAALGLRECVETSWSQAWDLTSRSSRTATLAVETRGQSQFIPMQGVPGRSFENVGLDVKWEGFKTKTERYLKVIKDQVARAPKELMILMDSDVANGGCPEAQLLERYHKIVAQSEGAAVVVAADSNQYPPIKDGLDKFRTPRFQKRRRAIMSAFGLPLDAMTHFCARNWEGAIPIAVDYAFVNSGFLMGPANELAFVLDCMMAEGWDKECLKKPSCNIPLLARRQVAGNGTQCCFDDQRALSLCALKYPNRISIDYAGALMMTTYGMYNMFQVERRGIHNKVLGSTQCFVHANAHDTTQPVKWDAWVAGLRGTYGGT